MSLHPKDFSVVPEQTAEVARAAFSKGNPYMTLRDELGVIYSDRTIAFYRCAPLAAGRQNTQRQRQRSRYRFLSRLLRW